MVLTEHIGFTLASYFFDHICTYMYDKWNPVWLLLIPNLSVNVGTPIVVINLI